jgi:DNA-binding NarL/FixJ family response regulator
MDIRLRNGSSGIEAAAKIKERHGLRCIFLSGNDDRETVAATTALDPVAFLIKPVWPPLLKSALAQAAAL